MPYVYDSNLEEEEKEAQGEPPALTPGDTSSSAGAAGEAGSKKPTSSGQFQNLDAYLTANAGQNFGENVAGKVGSQVDEAKENTTQAKSVFHGKVDQGTTQFDQGAVDEAISNPAAFVADPEKLSSFTKRRDASYQGPQSSSDDADFAKAFEQSQKAYRQSENTKSEGGRFALLDEFFRRPTYSQGEKSLDNLLVQNDPNAKGAFQQVQARGNDVPSEYQTAAQEASQYANQGVATTQQARAKTRAAIGLKDDGTLASDAPIAKEREKLNAKLDAETRRRKERADALREGAFSSDLSDENLAFYGEPRGTYTYGVNPADYIEASASPTASSIASLEEQGKLAALAKLAGAGDSYVTEAELAGTYDPSKALAFNKDAYGRQLSTAQADSSATLEPLAREITTLESKVNALAQRLASEQEKYSNIDIPPDSQESVRALQAQLQNAQAQLGNSRTFYAGTLQRLKGRAIGGDPAAALEPRHFKHR